MDKRYGRLEMDRDGSEDSIIEGDVSATTKVSTTTSPAPVVRY